MAGFNDEISADAYFMRRLARARQADTLPASLQFDLARSPIPDSQLGDVLSEFGVQEGNGWGIADMTNRLLSGQPETKAVGDIEQLQTNLKLQGYLPPSYTPNGTWDDTSYQALRQADRDAYETQRSGKGLLAVPVSTGMRLITDTLPSRVWQGVIGSAKGLIAQGQETAERVGALGGAAGGALIGTAIAPGVGTAIGAGVGAAIGFFGDLFGEEEDENGGEGESGWMNLLDALQPFNEYTQNKDGVHQFFEDLSFVGTAASLAAGVGIAGRGVQGALGAARGAVEASEVAASPGAMGALSGLENVPGTLVRTPGTGMSFGKAMLTPAAGAKSTGGLAMALEHPVATGAVLGGFQGMADPNAGILDVVESAAFGAAAGLAFRAVSSGKLIPGTGNWVQSLRGFQDAHAIMTRPIFKLANGLYTGMAAGSIGARVFSGELFDTEGKAGTQIAQSIRQTKPLSSGMEIPIAGDLVDAASFLLYPEQILPFKIGEAARAFDGLLGESGLKPMIILAQHNTQMSVGKARAWAQEFFTGREAMYTKMHMDGAVTMETVRRLNEQGIQEANNTIAFTRTKSDIIKQIHEEAKASGNGRSELGQRILNEFVSDEEQVMTYFLHQMGGEGPFPERIQAYSEAEEHLLSFQRDARKAGTLVEEGPNQLSAIMHQLPGGQVRAITPTVVPSGYVQENAQRLLLSQLTRERSARASALSKTERALGRDLRGDAIAETTRNIQMLKQDIKAYDTQIEALKAAGSRRKRLADEVHIIPARKETHTRNTLHERAASFGEVRDRFQSALEAEKKVDPEDVLALQEASSVVGVRQQEFDQFVSSLQDEGLITPRQAEKVMAKGGKGRAGKDIENALEAQALVAARDIELPRETMAYLDERGYKPVVSGDDVFLSPEFDSIVNTMQVGKYGKVRNLVESMGLGTKQVREDNLYGIVHASMVSEVDHVLAKADIPLSGKQALKKLQTYLESRNAKAVVEFPVIGPIATAVKFKADIRRLSPAEVETALGGIKGFDSTAANEVYQALKRGGAFGEDIQLRHPILAARTLGRATKITGLPGFSQVIRTWHGKVDPFALKGDVLKKDIVYRPPADLAKSVQRNRVVTEARTAGKLAGIAERELREGERFFDVVAESAVRHRPDLYPSVDDFYRSISVRYQDDFMEMADTLHQIRWQKKAPTTVRMEKMALAAESSKNWWSTSAHEIQEMFNGGVTQLRDGSTISDARLMVNLIAATSYRAAPDVNVQFALKNLIAFKEGRELPGQLEAVTKMRDMIFDGHTIDKWGSDLQKQYPVAYGKHQNLTGDLKTITYDTVMERFMGMPKEKGAPLIEATAKRLGWEPAEVQAAQWVAFKDETARLLEMDRARALKAGDMAEAAVLKRQITQARKATTYDEALHLPKAQAYYDVYGQSLGQRTLQQVEDTVRGSITFGEHDQMAIKLYSTGGFDTLVHENAHLLRRILPENDVLRLEEAYGLRRLNGPEGPSPEIREIAAEYHAKSGIRQDKDLLDQYPDVDEARAMRIADAFEAGKDAANDPAVRASYEKFAQESMDQYDVISQHIEMIPYAGKGQPYKNAAEFIEDVRTNHRLFYFKTLQEDAFGAGKISDEAIAKNPLLAYSGKTVLDSAGNPYAQTYNDIFRAIHDVIAHAKEGVQTGARGEESAWRAHAAMYSKEARRAMTTETRGQNSWVNFGPHLRQEGKIAAKGEPGYVPLQERPFADQKVMLLPEEFSQIENVRWNVDAEERFADDITAYMYGQYRGNQKGIMGSVRSAIATHWARNREAFLDAGVVPLGMRRHFDDLLRPDMEKLGLRRTPSSMRSKSVLVGAGLGAAEGALTGDDTFEDTLKGALFGAGVGFGVDKAMQKSYGYLPDALANLNMALRYTMSFTFDAGRFMEQNSIAMAKYGLPPMMSPKKHLAARNWKTPYAAGEVTGDVAIQHANQFYDELNGTNYFAHMPEFEQRNFQRGLLGFAPREWEVTQAFQMYQRGWSKDMIHERIAELGRYGTSRTNFERSANFVFFPFSFSKKMVKTLGDFVFQTPGRNLMIHEGLRRYHESLVDDEFNALVEDKLPILEQLWLVNNLAFGASVGRFFMDGYADRRTGMGQAAQILASIFVPSGAATPMQQGFGALGDLSVGAFTPVVITGESLSRAGGIDGLDDIIKRYVPFIREVDKWATTLNDQKVAAVSPQHLTPWSQFREYMEGVDEAEAQYEPLANAMGFSTVAGFLDSPMGAIMGGEDLDRTKQSLREQYPQGWELTTKFENQDSIDSAAIQDLVKKPEKSDGEEAFLELLERQQSLQTFSQYLPETVAATMEQQAIRSFATRWVADPRFAELYDRFMTRTYGPIRRVA